MQFLYQTERLLIRILTSSDAPMVLDFYERNKEAFAPWEPLPDKMFYNLDYQIENLDAEMKLFLKNHTIRFYLSEILKPDRIIGTLSFTNIQQGSTGSCNIGYRIDKDCQRNGFASEALRFMLPIVMKDMHLYRIEADIMVNNAASIKLIEAMGFAYEGISRKSHEIMGTREDHMRYSLIYTDVFE